MGTPIIFNGTAAKLLKNVLKSLNGQNITFGSADPTSAAQTGSKGDLYISSHTSAYGVYAKSDSGSSTNWKKSLTLLDLLASSVGFTPAGTISATNVQSAIAELDSETQTALGLKADAAATTSALAGKQPLDTDLTTIAGLTATTDSFLQSKSSAWAARTIAQVKVDLGLTGTNSGDQTITLTGDATGTGTGSFAVTVVQVGGKLAAAVATSVDDTLVATAAATASVIGKRDANKNIYFNAGFNLAVSTATAAGTTTLTVASPHLQIWTGSTTQTIKLPAGSTYTQIGAKFLIKNDSTGLLTIQDSAAGALSTIQPSSCKEFTLTSISSTGTWSIQSNYGDAFPVYVAQSSSFTAAVTSKNVVYLLTGAGSYTINLPGCAGNMGQVYTFIKSDSNANVYTLDGSAAETIQGRATQDIVCRFDQLMIYCTGTEWLILADGRNPFTTAITSDTSVGLTYSTIRVSGASAAVTITLPAAAGVTGYIYRIKRTDTTIANLVTIDANSTETIDGALTKLLFAQYDELTIQSNGTGWDVVGSHLISNWTAYTPTFTGFGTAASVAFFWRRNGDSIEIKGRFAIGTPTAVEARISLPTNVTSDTSKVSSVFDNLGTFIRSASSALYFTTYALIEPTKTYMTISRQTSTTDATTKVNGDVFSSSESLNLQIVTIPVAGW